VAASFAALRRFGHRACKQSCGFDAAARALRVTAADSSDQTVSLKALLLAQVSAARERSVLAKPKAGAAQLWQRVLAPACRARERIAQAA